VELSREYYSCHSIKAATFWLILFPVGLPAKSFKQRISQSVDVVAQAQGMFDAESLKIMETKTSFILKLEESAAHRISGQIDAVKNQ